jgi:hypothetical protein
VSNLLRQASKCDAGLPPRFAYSASVKLAGEFQSNDAVEKLGELMGRKAGGGPAG